MTDLEMTKLCAVAMGYSVVKGDRRYKNGMAIATEDGEPVTNYDPLAHDAQAMALVKKFTLRIDRSKGIPERWGVYSRRDYGDMTMNDDLNRAIVQCVAQMQAAKVPATTSRSFASAPNPEERLTRLSLCRRG